MRTSPGVPVEKDFEYVVASDGRFTRVLIVVNAATGRPYARLTDGTIVPIALGAGTTSGTNTGDQTSIVGITGSLAEFNAALTGADFATGGGTVTGASSGTNTGDQASIVGITGTIAQFNTACTDADFATGGGTATGTNTGDQTSVSGNAGTATALQTARALWGNNFDGTAAVDGKITASTNGIDVPASAAGTCHSGTYTPVLTNGTNVAASTAYLCQYMRVGNVVTVSGLVDIDPTVTGTLSLGMSLPVASNFTSSIQAGGNATNVSSVTYTILADAANDRVTINGVAASAANDNFWFHFTYLVN